MPNFSEFTTDTKTFYQRNYEEALEKIIPNVYFIEDLTLSGNEISDQSEVINSNIVMAQNIKSLLNVSAVGSFSSINSFSSIGQFFVKQNEKTHITPFLFEKNILVPASLTFGSYATSADWKIFVDATLQGWLSLNNYGQKVEFNGIAAPFGLTAAKVHEYFIKNLGWLYLLNTSGISDGETAPSSLITERLYDIYNNKSYNTQDGVNDLTEYVWKNYYQSPTVSAMKAIVPTKFASSTGTWTSGTQQLTKIQTLNSILYSTFQADITDRLVQTTFQNFQDTSSTGGLTTTETKGGPFSKFIRAISYGIYDVNAQIEGLQDLYDIENVPDKFLPYIADLIGWKFIGSDPNKWRNQLRRAVQVYKNTGTKKSVQLGLNTLFGDDIYSLSAAIFETYESYIPFMIYYALITESPFFQSDKFKENPFSTWTQEIATQLGVGDYSHYDMTRNIEYCVDHILWYMVQQYPEYFVLGGKPFPLGDPDFTFSYRNRIFPIPPYEEIRWYEGTNLSQTFLDTLRYKLSTFGISTEFLNSMFEYIGDHTLSSLSDISLQSGFLFFTSGGFDPPNFSTILNNLDNSKAKYLTLWQGKSSHFDTLLYNADYTFSKYDMTKDTTLGLQKAIKVLEEFAPAHAIPRVKLILPFDESMAQSTYQLAQCRRVIPTPSDMITGSSVLNAFACSATDMGSTQLSSAGRSRLLVDSLKDSLISSLSVTSSPRNNLRRRNFKKLLPRDGHHTRTGFNMPTSLYPSALEYSLPVSGGGMFTLGLSYSSCDFVPIQDTYYNTKNAQKRPNVDLISTNRGATVNELRWKAILSPSDSGDPVTPWEDDPYAASSNPLINKNVEFGVSAILDPSGISYVRPLLTSSLMQSDAATTAVPSSGTLNGGIRCSPKAVKASQSGFVDPQDINCTFYIKNYNSPGATDPTDDFPAFYIKMTWRPITANTKPYWIAGKWWWDGTDTTTLGHKQKYYPLDWEMPYTNQEGVPLYILQVGDFPSYKSVGDGWYECSLKLPILPDLAATVNGLDPNAPLNGLYEPYVDIEIIPHLRSDVATVVTTTLNAEEYFLQDYRGSYVWGIRAVSDPISPGVIPYAEVYDSSSSEVWAPAQGLTSSSVIDSVETSTTFPIRGLPSYSLSTIINNNECNMYRDRGSLAPIYRAMLRVQQKINIADIKNDWSALSGVYSASAAWWDPYTSLANSSAGETDFDGFKFGQLFHQTYRDYTKLFHSHGTNLGIASSVEGGPTIFSHVYGPLLFNGSCDITGPTDIISSSIYSPYFLSESYFSDYKNHDKWQRGYLITPETNNNANLTNSLTYTDNFDPRVTTWKYGGPDKGALAASAMFPPWGPLRWTSSSLVPPPNGVSSVFDENVPPSGTISEGAPEPNTSGLGFPLYDPYHYDAQILVQGASGINTWGWGAVETPTPQIGSYFTSAQLFSIFVKKIGGEVPLGDSMVTLHGMQTSDTGTSSQFFALNLKNITQDVQSSSAGDNLIEFCWSGVSGGVENTSAIEVCAVSGGDIGGDLPPPPPSSVAPSNCGNGWWRVGIIVSGEPSSIDYPKEVYNAGFTSAESGQWSPTYPIKGIRQALIYPAGMGFGTSGDGDTTSNTSSLSAFDYKGQFFFGAQLEDLSWDQVDAFNNSTTSSFTDLSSTYIPVRTGGKKCFDIALGGIPEYRDGSIISGIEFVIPSGSTPSYTPNNLEQSSLEVTSFNYEGTQYNTTPGANYFRALKLDPTFKAHYPNNPFINRGIVLVNAQVPGLYPRLRLPLSNTRFPVYRRDYVDYPQSYWPQSQLTNEVSSIQNSVTGFASINETNTDQYLYRRSLSDTSSYHKNIYEAQSQKPFETKTSN